VRRFNHLVVVSLNSMLGCRLHRLHDLDCLRRLHELDGLDRLRACCWTQAGRAA
jgi:hypothetical protein